MNRAIVVVGSINMDLVVRAPRHPAPGETILGTDFQTFPGGKGANQAVAAARLGGRVRMIGRVGEDGFGDQLVETLRRDGVDTSFVRRTEGIASGVALITVSESGQNNIVVVPGSNGGLTPEDVLASQDAFEDAAVVLIQLEIPLETVQEAVRVARDYGARVILNPAPAQSLPPELLAQVDYLVPNEHELKQLSGGAVSTLPQDQRQRLGVGCLIVTLGSSGVEVVEKNGIHRILPHTVQAVDTTAAGDAFVGAFGVALTEGRSTSEAAAFGNAAGALSVTKAGAQPSLPTRAELEEFLQQQPTRWGE